MSFDEGMRLFREKKYSEAAEKFNDAIESDDQNPKIWNAYGVTLSKLGKFEDAETCFENALLLDPGHLTYQKNLDSLINKKEIPSQTNSSNRNLNNYNRTNENSILDIQFGGYPLSKILLFGIGGIFLLIILSSIIAGFSPSASEEIEQSRLIYNAGIERIFFIDYAQGATEESKIDATIAEFQSALNVLNGAKTSHSEEKKIIETYKLIGESSIKIAEAQKDVLLTMNSLTKFDSYINTNNINGARNEIASSKKHISNALNKLKEAQTIANSINPDDAYPEIQGFIVNLKKGLENTKNINDVSSMLDGVDYMLIGIDHVMKAQDYANGNDVVNTKNELSLAVSEFSKSKPIFTNLENSKIPEISSFAIYAGSIVNDMTNLINELKAMIDQYQSQQYYY